jgi:hypothetical protein
MADPVTFREAPPEPTQPRMEAIVDRVAFTVARLSSMPLRWHVVARPCVEFIHYDAPHVTATFIVRDPTHAAEVAPAIACEIAAMEQRIAAILAPAKTSPVERAATDANGSPVESVGPMDPQALAESVARSAAPAVEGA